MAVYSYNKTFRRIIVAILLFSGLLLGGFWIHREIRYHNATLQQVQDDYVDLRKSEVKTIIDELINEIEFHKAEVETHLKKNIGEQVRLALRIAHTLYRERGDKSEEDVKNQIIMTLMAMRFFDGRGYYWIHDLDHTLIAHPYRQLAIDQSDLFFQDTRGNLVVQDFIRTALDNPDGGFVSYDWINPQDHNYYSTTVEEQKKIAFVQLFKPYNWVIGVAEYVNDVTVQTQESMIERIAQVRYGEAGYIFNHTRDGFCLNHIEPDNIGRSRWELRDAAGMKIVQELDRVGRQPGGGFLEYHASIDPRTDLPAKKLSYVRSVDDWGWVLGGGIYLEDIEQQIAKLQADMTRQLHANLWIAVTALLLTLVLVYFVVREFMAWLSHELGYLTTRDATGAIAAIDLDRFRIRELREVATELGQHQQQSRQLEVFLRQRNAALEQFNYTVSHELKTPLVTTESFLGMLEYDLERGNRQHIPKNIGFIRSAVRRMNQLLDGLSKMYHTGTSSSPPTTLAYPDIVHAACKNLNLERDDTVVDIRITPETMTLFADEAQLQVVWKNLIGNAVKYMGDQPHPLIEIGVRRQDAETVFYVADNGMGIAPQYHEKVFGLFDKLIQGSEGSGLGLALVKQVVTFYDGRIWVESEGEGRGSCFCFTLPRALLAEGISL